MLYISWMVILGDHTIKKISFGDILIFEWYGLKNSIITLWTNRLGEPLRLYISWMVILGDHNIKKISFGNSDF